MLRDSYARLLSSAILFALIGTFSGCEQLTAPTETAGESNPPEAAEPTEPLEVADFPTIKDWSRDIYDNGEDGFMIKYSHKVCRTSTMVYVLEREEKVPDGYDSPEIQNEYALAASAIEEYGLYSAAKRMDDKLIPWGRDGQIPRMRYVTIMNLGAMVSDTMITGRGGKVVKVRLTRSWPLDADEEAVIEEFLKDLSQAI